MNRYRVFLAGLGLMFPEVNQPKENAHGWMGGASGYMNKWFGAGFEIAGQFGNMSTPSGTPSGEL